MGLRSRSPTRDETEEQCPISGSNSWRAIRSAHAQLSGPGCLQQKVPHANAGLEAKPRKKRAEKTRNTCRLNPSHTVWQAAPVMIEVRPVNSRRMLGQFIDFPYTNYRPRPHWTPQFRLSE